MDTKLHHVACGSQKVALIRDSIPEPTTCPITGGPVGRRTLVTGKKSVHIYSLAPNNPSVLKGKIRKWISSLNIQGLGETYVEAFFDAKALGTPADLYRLQDLNLDLLAGIGNPKIGMSRLKDVLAEIEKKRVLTLTEFLGSLGVHMLDQRRVELVRRKDRGQFDQIEDWIGGKLVERAKEAGLPKSAPGIYEGIKQAFPLIAELLEVGVTIRPDVVEEAPAPQEGQICFCLTGNFTCPKEDYHIKIINAGHRYVESYTKKAGIGYVVVADPSAPPSTKVKKAQKDDVKVIGAAELLELLK